MSLINEMLRDLEARRASELGKHDLQREIRPLPGRRPPPGRGARVALVGLVSVATIGAAVWGWQADIWSMKTATLQVYSKPGASPAAVPPVTSAPVPAPPIQVEVSPAVVAEALRLAEAPNGLSPPAASPVSEQAVSSEPAKAAKSPLRPNESEIVPAVSRMSTALPTKAELVAVKTNEAANAPLTQGNIEKTIVLGTPRERADAEYRRAQGLLAAGAAAPQAIEFLQNALKQDSSYGPARQLLLRVFLESRRIDEAMALLREGLELQPAQIGWAMSLARLQAERGDVAAGERTLARFRAYGATSAEYLGFHGYLLQRIGQFQEAADQYLSATRISQADGRWWFGLGQALEAGGHAEDARVAFRRALESGNLNADLTVLAEQKTR